MGSRNRNLLDILNVLFILIAITYAKTVRKKSNEDNIRRHGMQNDVEILNDGGKEDKCWMKLGSAEHFNTMNALDAQYADVRKKFEQALNLNDFDQEMYKVMLQSQGASGKVYIKSGGDANRIPSGLNLGGFCMMRMNDSVLFFHRLKLRNDTFFRLNYLHTDLDKMILTGRLALNDLHLSGSYERAITDKNPSNLFYRPTFGNIIFLLRNVQYKMEGRYRLVQDKLMIENIISSIDASEVLMNYVVNGTLQRPEKLPKKSVEEFVNKIRIDMDKWLKHYFNDYLLYFELGSAGPKNLREYDVKKAFELNKFVDQSITLMRKRLFVIRCANVKIPNFQIYTINGMEIKLRDGVVRGLDSMHRRSVATGKGSESNMRKVDVVIGFSNLKVEYKYDARLASGTTPMHGMFILTADDLTASLSISLVNEPEFVDLKFDFLEQPKPESLVVEGPINRRIANIRHLLENHIISLMSNMLYYQITMLKTITHCVPKLIPHMDPGDDYDPSGDRKNFKKEAEYAANRQDSIEIEIPGKPGMPMKRMKIKYGEEFALIDLGDILGSPTSPPDVKNEPHQNQDDTPDTVVDNQLNENKMAPAFPYGLSRVDSAEVVVNQDGVPKTLHLKYNESYIMNDKNNPIHSSNDPSNDAATNVEVPSENDDDDEATKKLSIRVHQNLSDTEAKFVLSKILRGKRNGTLRNKSVRTVLPTDKKIGRKFNKIVYKHKRKLSKQKLRRAPPIKSGIKTNQKIKRNVNSLPEQKIFKHHSAITKTAVNRNITPIQRVGKSKINKVLNTTRAKLLHRHNQVLKKQLRNVQKSQKIKKSVISNISNEPLVSKKTFSDKISPATGKKINRNLSFITMKPKPTNIPPRNLIATKIVNNNTNGDKINVNSIIVKTQSNYNKDNHKISDNKPSNKKLVFRSAQTISKISKRKAILNKTMTKKVAIETQKSNNKMKRSKALPGPQKKRKSTNNSLPLDNHHNRVASGGNRLFVTNNNYRAVDNKTQNVTHLSSKPTAFLQANKQETIFKKTAKKASTSKDRRAKNEAKLPGIKNIRSAMQINKTLLKNTKKRSGPKRKSADLGAPIYEMERQDSAEVQIPGETGSSSTTMHINYKQNFKLNDPSGSNSLDTFVPTTDPISSDVESRNLNDLLTGLQNYAMHRYDSAEVELPGEGGSAPKTVHIDYKQKFELNDKGSPDATPVDTPNPSGDQAKSDVENRNQEVPVDGPQNYAMERQDSAEVELPGEAGSPPKTVHIDYKQKFELNDKGSVSGNTPDTSAGGDQAKLDVENRNQEAPTDSPQNYAMERHDSAEVELPGESGSPPKTVHIDYKQKFELNDKGSVSGNTPDASAGGDQAKSDVENRNQEAPTDSPQNYAMERHDSAEVELPGESGSPPKTVHIDYKQKFELNDKGSVSGNTPDASAGGDQAKSDVENRNQETPTDGPQNYAMERHDSAEVQLPGESRSPPKTVHIDYKQNFELNDKGSPDATPVDAPNASGDQAKSDVENRNQEAPVDGPQNYAMERQDSAEVELLGEAGSPPKTVHIDYKQKFELNNKGSVSGNTPDATPVDTPSAGGDQAKPDVENRNQKAPTDGPQNYTMERHDSAEVELPGESGWPPKTVHIDYKQKFELNDKGSVSGNTPDATPVDDPSAGGDQAKSDVENRNQKAPTDGPQYYTMERHDSAEVELPGAAGSPPKTMHIDYKQKFELNDKGSVSGNTPDATPVDAPSADGDQAKSDVKNRNQKAPTDGPQNYAMERHDSAEVELPGESGSPPKTVHIDYKQKFELNDKGSVSGNTPDATPVDVPSAGGDQAKSDVKNRNQEAPIDGPQNYAMERQDSAEVELPGEAGSPPKTVHIDYKQKFELNDKGSVSGNTPDISAGGDQAKSDVENRNQEAPTDSPQNYAMERHDSAEVELPGESGSPPKTVHIDYKQKFELNDKGSVSGNTPDASAGGDQSKSDVENRNQEAPVDGPQNYAMERQDSAEVELPGEAGSPPKTMHIDYKQKFKLNDKGSVSGNTPDTSAGGDQAKLDVENRNQEAPTDGPPNYAMERHDSAEVELPGEAGSPPKTMHIDYKQKFELNDEGSVSGNTPDVTPVDASSAGGDQAKSDVENRNQEAPVDGPQNYAMERHDSAEVELSGEAGSPPKTVHIDYKQKFELNDKGSVSGNMPDASAGGDQAKSDVENRNQEAPTDGPQNYAMESQDSAEVELPEEAGSPSKTVHIDYKQKFELNDKGSSLGNKPDAIPIADNKNIGAPSDGPQNYSMQRHDSAEVELPGDAKSPPKTVHIDYKQNFEVNEKDGTNGSNAPISHTDTAISDQTTSGVENRHLDSPGDGPMNYAMNRQDSVEVELPGEGGAPPKTVHINHQENFALKDTDAPPSGGGSNIDPEQTTADNPPSSDVENRNHDVPSEGPMNYAMNRQDSVEVELPGEGGASPKAVHINYQENFALKDTGAPPSGGGSNIDPEQTTADNLPSSDVENRNRDIPSEGSMNYAMNRQDSVEVELPGEGGAPPKTVHINHQENFALKDTGAPPSGGGRNIDPEQTTGTNLLSSDVENRNSEGPLNYAMERQDSAEVELPGESGAPPKTVHINYKENFVLDDKGRSSGGNPPSDQTSPDSIPVDNKRPDSSAAKDRNLDDTHGGPLNYAMNRKDSAEITLPGEGGAPPKNVHINYKENFALKDTGAAPSGGGSNIAPEQSTGDNPSSSDVMNRNHDSTSEGPINYAMQRQDSAEVEIPGQGGVPPKIVHINYNENFKLDDKIGANGNNAPAMPPGLRNNPDDHFSAAENKLSEGADESHGSGEIVYTQHEHAEPTDKYILRNANLPTNSIVNLTKHEDNNLLVKFNSLLP